MKMSFHSFQSCLPSLSGQNVIISMAGGKISASAELLNAPTSEIIPLKFGMSAAAVTVGQMTHYIITDNNYRICLDKQMFS